MFGQYLLELAGLVEDSTDTTLVLSSPKFKRQYRHNSVARCRPDSIDHAINSFHSMFQS